MNQIKPLDQVLSIEADAHNQITKVVNKDDNENILVLSNKNLISVPTTELRSQKRRTRGCRLKRLSEGEYIVNACKD